MKNYTHALADEKLADDEWKQEPHAAFDGSAFNTVSVHLFKGGVVQSHPERGVGAGIKQGHVEVFFHPATLPMLREVVKRLEAQTKGGA